MYGLTDEQSDLLYDLAKIFRTQNISIKNKLSDEQYKMLGRVTEAFLKK